MSGVRLWLDDLRPAPKGWNWCRTATEAIDMLKTSGVLELSLDHDLGDDKLGTGYTVALWLEEKAYEGKWEVIPSTIRVHSANPVGAARIHQALEKIRQAKSINFCD